ncbi:hypothetical protein NQ315_014372 [Exocentrus adspersus]|uniref:Regulatory protein zeste n=1 Tax=Exocentrus adspersus TaxID=1586481 RepID=A0AAV8V7P6_9CUCU|nr:hypothetical protein NQ315_014372 [Exocentrus adspersus]
MEMVDKKSSKNKRAANFSNKEESILITLIKEKYASRIENKKTDTNANKSRNEAWLQLAKDFNSYCGDVYRDPQVLRSKYLNIKKRAKKNFSEEKKYVYGTGGGPPQTSDITDIDNDVKEIIGSQMTGFSSKWDNDENTEAELGDTSTILVVDDENVSNAEACVEDFGTLASTSASCGRSIILQEKDMNIISSESVEGDPHVPVQAPRRLFSSTVRCSNDKIVGGESHALVKTPRTATLSNMKMQDNSNSKDWSSYTPQKLKRPISTQLKYNTKKKPENALRTRSGVWAQSKEDLVSEQKKIP